MGLAYLTSALGGTDLGVVLEELDPGELDAWLAVGIDALARLRSDTADTLHADGINGAFVVSYDEHGVTRVPVIDTDAEPTGPIAALVVAVSRSDLHHRGDLDR